jgi:uncharacterized protein (DUF362 family)
VKRCGMNRREFLVRGAAGTGGLLLSSLLYPGCGDGTAQLRAPDAFAPDLVAPPGADVAPDVAPAPSTAVYAITGESTGEFYDMGIAATKALGFHGRALAGATVFLKPNFVTLGLEIMRVQFDPAVGECTKPEIVAAVAEQCLAAGAAKVIIGEGAQTRKWDWATLRFLDGNAVAAATHLKAAVERLQSNYRDREVELLCLNDIEDWTAIPSSSLHPNVANGLSVSRAFAEADHVISLPVMKSHRWALVTAAMKNYVGLVSSEIHGNGLSRCKLHLAYKDATCFGIESAGVAASFVDIHKWRMEEGKEDFAILDGTICLEGDGPHTAPVFDNDGKTIHLRDRNRAGQYFLLASNDLTAMDVTATRLMGIPVGEVKSLRMCAYLGLGEMEQIRLVGADLADLRIDDWLMPEPLSDAYFEPLPGCRV